MKTSLRSRNHLSPNLPLIDSKQHPAGMRGIRGRLLAGLFRRLFGVVKPGEDHSLPNPVIFSPFNKSKVYGITHFGIMISDLPAPHYFMANASTLGASSLRVFDIDFAVQSEDGPRHTAALTHGTAVAVDGHFTHYSILRETTLRQDGSLVRFGDDLEISGLYPNYRLRSQRPGFSVDLELTATGDITWFAKSSIYNHLALMTRYQGTVTCAGVVTPVSGLCSYEYARGFTPYLLVNRALPQRFKIPWDFFSYQVITLDADTQLLLVHCRIADYPTLTSAYLRRAGQGSQRIAGDVHFKVSRTQAQTAIAPNGSATVLPEKFSWTIQDNTGTHCFEINATVDTPMLFGLGMGYVGGYRWEGRWNGKPAEGRGYIEYVDQRD